MMNNMQITDGLASWHTSWGVNKTAISKRGTQGSHEARQQKWIFQDPLFSEEKFHFFVKSSSILNQIQYVASAEHRDYMAAAYAANNEILFSGEFADRKPAKTKRGNQKLKPRNGEKRKREVEVVDVEQSQRAREQELTRDMTFEQGSYPWDNPRNEIIDWLKRPVRLCRTNRKVTPEHKAWFNGLLIEFGLPTV